MWKVLIADDEKKVCELIQYLVPWEQLNLEVAAVVENGIDAIEILKHTKIDIIITDARMPETTFFSVALSNLSLCVFIDALSLLYVVVSLYASSSFSGLTSSYTT